MTNGDTFRKVGPSSYVYDPNGDYERNGTSIVPKEATWTTKPDCAWSHTCPQSERCTV